MYVFGKNRKANFDEDQFVHSVDTKTISVVKKEEEVFNCPE